MTHPNLWDAAKQIQEGAHSSTALPQEQENLTDNLNLHPEQLGKNKPSKISRKKGIMQVRAETNEKKWKKQ